MSRSYDRPVYLLRSDAHAAQVAIQKAILALCDGAGFIVMARPCTEVNEWLNLQLIDFAGTLSRHTKGHPEIVIVDSVDEMGYLEGNRLEGELR